MRAGTMYTALHSRRHNIGALLLLSPQGLAVPSILLDIMDEYLSSLFLDKTWGTYSTNKRLYIVIRPGRKELPWQNVFRLLLILEAGPQDGKCCFNYWIPG